MAPTEILATQHFQNFKDWFDGLPIKIDLVTASRKGADRKKLLADLKSGEVSMAIGTHALFEDQIAFSKLGLVIVDEQHRFGVRQRARLIAKGAQPDVLVMTATPIPRSLALTLYGDLDLSVIDELPPGRKPIHTKVFVEKQRGLLLEAMKRELAKGRQIFVVLPLIEDSEKLRLKSVETLLPELERDLKGFSVKALHGRMSSVEKQELIEDFRANRVSVLVATTVVEVGVDVPNATVMVVEHAERFGLSQLHQLRGRVGRGSSESHCFLMAAHQGSEEIYKRLKAMEKTQDGFKLAEIDLEMRGPGDFLGTRQSGMPLFELARLPRDTLWLERARRDAFELVEKDPEFSDFPKLQALMKERERLVSLN